MIVEEVYIVYLVYLVYGSEDLGGGCRGRGKERV